MSRKPKKRVVVICPGRGSYTKESLGSLLHRPGFAGELQELDQAREKRGYPSLSALDGAPSFKTSLHTKGEHASALIYACAKADFLELNQDQYEVVALMGNSMGWYLALAFAQVLHPTQAYHLIQTMGAMMEGGLIGGQIVYPLVDGAWQRQGERVAMVEALLEEVNGKGSQVYVSIHLGGYQVLAGNQKGLGELKKRLPKKDKYPLELINHGAFHTPLLKEVSEKALVALKELEFQAPSVPLIDGRGHIWTPHGTDEKKMAHYTLGAQVVEPYDFTKSLEVALKEFAPDHLILLGPGLSLRAPIGQVLVENRWQGMGDKAQFMERQARNPFLLTMGKA